ncbi:ABC transporter substrate-binding protein [Virgibacillus sp. YIM 98842]|uniref:ABC transporter substrate-binding protein n=1 Tax=Virgibacillus sp. YIM 98842 TaxID=2663533 RepID=UPI0013DA5D7F|nr:ABC transporter substrate-binding protein [Virgibacillus sp. YIM 98842]
MKNLHVLLFSLLLVTGILAGCGETEDDATDQTETETEQTEQPSSDESAFPVTMEGSDGEEVTIEEKPEAIVSLIPSNTEIAFALGLGNNIVGVSDHDNYPEEVQEKEKIGGLELNIEMILSLEPDLVLAHPTNSPEGIDQLKESGLTVLMVNDATNFDEVYESIEMMAEATGTKEEGENIITSMQDKLSELEEKAAGIPEDEVKSVYIEISPEPEIFTPGNNTFENEILTKINAENIAADQEGWIELSEEAIVEQNPEVIILSYDFVEDPVGQLMGRDAWQDIEAVKNEQVIQVDTDIISRPGPRLAEGAETLAKAIYPDVFEEQ